MKTAAKRSLNKTVSSANMTGAVKEYRLPTFQHEDGEGIVIPVQPVVLVNPTLEPSEINNAISIVGTGRGVSGQIMSVDRFGRYTQSTSSFAAFVNSAPYLYDAANAGNSEQQRTPTIFRHALCTSVAATAVWDPAAGKMFRIMGYVIIPAAGMVAAGIQLITLLDQAAAIVIAHQVYLPAAASIVNQPPIVVQFPGNGYLSVAADNILNCTLTSACTAGAISIMVYGTEE